MSVSTSIRLPDDIHKKLKHASRLRGKPVNRLIIEALEREFTEIPPDGMRADIALADIIGCVSSAGIDDGHDSSKSGEFFAEGMIKKHAEGHL